MDLTINITTRRPWIYRLFGFKYHKHTVTINGEQFKWHSTHKYSVVESIEMGIKYAPFPADYIKQFSNIELIDKDGNIWPLKSPQT